MELNPLHGHHHWLLLGGGAVALGALVWYKLNNQSSYLYPETSVGQGTGYLGADVTGTETPDTGVSYGGGFAIVNPGTDNTITNQNPFGDQITAALAAGQTALGNLVPTTTGSTSTDTALQAVVDNQNAATFWQNVKDAQTVVALSQVQQLQGAQAGLIKGGLLGQYEKLVGQTDAQFASGTNGPTAAVLAQPNVKAIGPLLANFN